MEIKVISQFDPAFKKQWLKLWQSSAFSNYSNSPYWFTAILESFHYSDYKIITVYRGPNLLAVAPLVAIRKFGFKVYTLPPADYVCKTPFLLDYQDTELLKYLFKHLPTIGQVVLENISKDFLEIFEAHSNQISSTNTTLNYYCRLVADVDGKFQVRHKNHLLQRAKSILAELRYADESDTPQESLQKAFTIEQQSYKQSQGYSSFADPQIRNFYETLAKTFGSHFRIHILYHQGQPIAYEIGFQVNSTYFGSQLSSTLAYREYSISRVMCVYLIEWLYKNNVTMLDLGSGDDSVKRSLTHEYHRLYQVVISNNYLLRGYYIYFFRLKNAVYDFLKKHGQLYSYYRRIRTHVKI